MIIAGAIDISEVLVGKRTLQVLNISYNNIGDDGITAIAKALINSQIRELYVVKCGITFTGARSLAAGLLVNKSVRLLYVHDNIITVKGAHVILQSAVNNETCQQVVTDYYFRNDKNELKKMMTILEQRREKEVGGCVVNNNDCCNANSGCGNQSLQNGIVMNMIAAVVRMITNLQDKRRPQVGIMFGYITISQR